MNSFEKKEEDINLASFGVAPVKREGEPISYGTGRDNCWKNEETRDFVWANNDLCDAIEELWSLNSLKTIDKIQNFYDNEEEMREFLGIVPKDLLSKDLLKVVSDLQCIYAKENESDFSKEAEERTKILNARMKK